VTPTRETKRRYIQRKRVERLGCAPHQASECFWTWPWGHRYEEGRCVWCRKIKRIGPGPSGY
jgi:hypothetical protein